jgi:L-alanine-DL-glutamate epimerase-like enolase superfamily enzyme
MTAPTIARARAVAVAPDVERFRYTAFEDEVFTTTTVVHVTDSDGAQGVGAYDADSYGGWDLAPLETLRSLLPRLIGCDARDRVGLEAMLTDDRTSPFPPAVRSTIDVALWDLAARREDAPLFRTLGGAADGVEPALPSYASAPLFEDEASYLSAIRGYVDEGYRAVKIHGWGDPERDASLLRAARSAFGSLTLMHDAECRYDADGAELVARAAADMGLRWLEGPLPDLDLAGYRSLRRAVPGVPVLPAGDAIWDPRLLAEALRDPPWDAVRFDVSFVGGPTAAVRLFAVAREADLDVELTSYGHSVIQAVNLHMALAFDRTSYFEQAVPVEVYEHGVRTPIRTDGDGLVHAPAGPGLGLDLDVDALEAASIGVAEARGEATG